MGSSDVTILEDRLALFSVGMGGGDELVPGGVTERRERLDARDDFRDGVW